MLENIRTRSSADVNKRVKRREIIDTFNAEAPVIDTELTLELADACLSTHGYRTLKREERRSLREMANINAAIIFSTHLH